MGVYAEFDDVAARYEDEMPSDREDWIELRIDDAEAELFGIIPSLADGTVVITDPSRAQRVKRLICDKILALYRNPDGAAVTLSHAAGPFNEARTLAAPRSQSWLTFTDDELARIGGGTKAGSSGSVVLRAYHYEPRL